MDFGYALNALKEGKKVFRAGWNGKGQYLFLFKGSPQEGPLCKAQEGWLMDDGHLARVLPYIVIRTVQETYVPWLASQTDLLADDWWIKEDIKQAEGGV